MAAVTRRQYKGAAAQTTITNALASGDTTITISANTGWPSTAAVPFFVVISPGTSSEEKCLATISGTTLTLTRAQDDTSAQSHSSGATIYPVFSADDADEANFVASRWTTKGDLVSFNGTDVARLGVGTNDYVLTADSAEATGLKWAASSVADGAITTAKLADANVTGAKLANLTVNDQVASYTLVVGDRNKRVIMNNASATTITVPNSVFAAGDTIFLANKGAGTTTITAGAGVTINSASGLTLVQYQSGTLIALSASTFLFVKEDVTVSAGGLVYLTEGTFSGVASVSMAAGTFTTTYKNYRVFLHATSTSTGQNIGVRVNVSGTAQTSSIYYGGWAAIDNSGTFSGFGSNGTSSAVFTNIASGSQAYGEFTIYDPANAATKTWWSGTMAGANSVGNTAGGAGGNLYNSAAAHDGLTFLVNGTFGGSYYVYGITD